ncbi:MAG TPA: S-methyl-5'-thioinosine phosphorylase [Gammaproteobacteria bacterium]|nr:S-methyl-5'-thioinosine phosphorylase [Gammaproteobacteria bacterium]|tara:strand:- start:618 stop:1358 length:741 start_codon:yes stop_codon:yes gene_type:complete
MSKIAIIGGSGLDVFSALSPIRSHQPVTPYGKPSAPVIEGRVGKQSLCFLPRHGTNHAIPPHCINYRANIAALKHLQVEDVVAITAVGGIAPTTPPRQIVIPDQIIDYTYDREHTFSDGLDNTVKHIDFSYPYCERLRQQLICAAQKVGVSAETSGTYGVTQGPRLETAAEIKRMARDGCTVVGMTGMPEAALAREVQLNYANCSIVVNWAAGITNGTIDLDKLEQNLKTGMEKVLALILNWVEQR